MPKREGGEKKYLYPNSDDSTLRFVSYWQLLGKVISFFCIPLLAFTILLALRLDGVITWSWWVVFSPAFATLLGFILATSSQTLSAPAPVQVRIIWMFWVISLALFVVFLVLRLEEESTLFRPSVLTMFLPLYAGLGFMFIVGLYLFIAGCCLVSQHIQKKYIVSAAPLFCFSIVFLPLVLLISFKEGVDRLPEHFSWAVIFIPLFVADAFCFCMGFFLLIFSFGGRNDAIFSIFQLFVFLVAIPVAVTFKVLLVLYLDKVLNISILFVFIPLLVLEALLLTCGLATIKKHKSKKNKYLPVTIAT